MINNKARYIMIVLFVILLIVELFIYGYNSGFNWKNTLRLATPILMIITMTLSIKNVNKYGEK